MSTELEVLYDPAKGTVGCVLVQAGYGLPDGVRVASMFDTADWELTPTPGLRQLKATLAEWERLASLTRQQRAELWSLHSG